MAMGWLTIHTRGCLAGRDNRAISAERQPSLVRYAPTHKNDLAESITDPEVPEETAAERWLSYRVKVLPAARSGFRRTSLSHTRMTVPSELLAEHGSLCGHVDDSVSIFATQYDEFHPAASLVFLFDHWRPCQKSPSQNTSDPVVARSPSLDGRQRFEGQAIPNAGGPKSLSQEDLRSGILTTIAGPNSARLCTARTIVLVAGHRQRALPGRHVCSAGYARLARGP